MEACATARPRPRAMSHRFDRTGSDELRPGPIPSRRGRDDLREVLDEQHAVLAGPVVVLGHTVDLETERRVKPDRHLVHG